MNLDLASQISQLPHSRVKQISEFLCYSLSPRFFKHRMDKESPNHVFSQHGLSHFELISLALVSSHGGRGVAQQTELRRAPTATSLQHSHLQIRTVSAGHPELPAFWVPQLCPWFYLRKSTSGTPLSSPTAWRLPTLASLDRMLWVSTLLKGGFRG